MKTYFRETGYYVDSLSIVRLMKYRIMLWHAVPMGKTRDICRILVGKFVSNPRRWQDNIERNLMRCIMSVAQYYMP